VWGSSFKGEFSRIFIFIFIFYKCSPELFRLAHLPEASVAALMRLQGSSIHWDVIFTKAVQDWEMESMVSIMVIIYSCPTFRGGLDSLGWCLSRSKKFEVKSYYKALIQSAQSPFPWRSFWKVKVPTRIAFFTWNAALGKILTIDNLGKRKVIITDWCCMCKRGGESVSHLLLHCPVSQELWGLVFALFWVSWVMPQDVEDLLACWAGRFGKC
jgi:hypothetical protein